MRLRSIEIVEDRTAHGRCDEGFITVSRLVLQNVYEDGSTSEPYPCDIASRPGSDAVVAILYELGADGDVRVILREGPRAPIYLRNHKRFEHPDPREYRSIVEVVAGLLEPGDGSDEDGLRRRASIEAREEAGSRPRPRGVHSRRRGELREPGNQRREGLLLCWPGSGGHGRAPRRRLRHGRSVTARAARARPRHRALSRGTNSGYENRSGPAATGGSPGLHPPAGLLPSRATAELAAALPTTRRGRGRSGGKALSGPVIGLIGARRTRQGLGPFVARELHAAGAAVACVVGTHPETAQEARRQLRDEHRIDVRSYADVDTMLSRERLDAVAILSPTRRTSATWSARSPPVCTCSAKSPWCGVLPTSRNARRRSSIALQIAACSCGRTASGPTRCRRFESCTRSSDRTHLRAFRWSCLRPPAGAACSGTASPTRSACSRRSFQGPPVRSSPPVSTWVPNAPWSGSSTGQRTPPSRSRSRSRERLSSASGRVRHRRAPGAAPGPTSGLRAELLGGGPERDGPGPTAGSDPRLPRRAPGLPRGRPGSSKQLDRGSHGPAPDAGHGLRDRQLGGRTPSWLVRSRNWSTLIRRVPASGRVGASRRAPLRGDGGARDPRFHGQAQTTDPGTSRGGLCALAPGVLAARERGRAGAECTRARADLHQPGPHDRLQLRVHALHRLGHPEHAAQVQGGRASRLDEAHGGPRHALRHSDRGWRADPLPAVRGVRRLLEGARPAGLDRLERQPLRSAGRRRGASRPARLDPALAGFGEQRAVREDAQSREQDARPRHHLRGCRQHQARQPMRAGRLLVHHRLEWRVSRR